MTTFYDHIVSPYRNCYRNRSIIVNSVHNCRNFNSMRLGGIRRVEGWRDPLTRRPSSRDVHVRSCARDTEAISRERASERARERASQPYRASPTRESKKRNSRGSMFPYTGLIHTCDTYCQFPIVPYPPPHRGKSRRSLIAASIGRRGREDEGLEGRDRHRMRRET